MGSTEGPPDHCPRQMELMEPGVQYMCMEGARFIASDVAEGQALEPAVKVDKI